MTALIGSAIFIFGVLVGFILNKLTGSSVIQNKELTNQVIKTEQALEEYKASVAEHIDSSAKVLEQMQSTCQDAMEQMAQSTKLLQEATPEDSASMPFFSQETQEQLAKTVQLRHKGANQPDIAITEAPLDYSGNPSGLFQDKKQPVTNVDTPKTELS